jgi:hypothetical protein
VGYFDPLGFSKDGDSKKLMRRRASERKHGRGAMFAARGFLPPRVLQVPGLPVPVPTAGGLQWILFAGFLETGLFKQEKDRAPGDFKNIAA